MLTRLTPEELCDVTPSVLHDVLLDTDDVTESGSPDEKDKQGGVAGRSVHRERVCTLADSYMTQMSVKVSRVSIIVKPAYFPRAHQ